MSYSLTSNTTVNTITLSNTGTMTFPTASGNYTITSYGGSGTSSSWGSMSPTDASRDVVIRRPNGKEIYVGAVLDQIMDMLMIIPQDDALHEKNPALKAAYEHHQSIIKDMLSNEKLRESYESYRTMRNLVAHENDD